MGKLSNILQRRGMHGKRGNTHTVAPTRVHSSGYRLHAGRTLSLLHPEKPATQRKGRESAHRSPRAHQPQFPTSTLSYQTALGMAPGLRGGQQIAREGAVSSSGKSLR